MLEVVGHPHAVPDDERLETYTRQHGWHIVTA
jgi:phosphoserine phosphatase